MIGSKYVEIAASRSIGKDERSRERRSWLGQFGDVKAEGGNITALLIDQVSADKRGSERDPSKRAHQNPASTLNQIPQHKVTLP